VLVYSQWNPEGTYDYYETPDRAPLGDDLGVPKLSSVNGIGVPSTEAGRAIPAGAKYVGSGERAVGVVAPMDTSHLGELAVQNIPAYVWFFIGATSMAVLWWVTEARRKR